MEILPGDVVLSFRASDSFLVIQATDEEVTLVWLDNGEVNKHPIKEFWHYNIFKNDVYIRSNGNVVPHIQFDHLRF